MERVVLSVYPTLIDSFYWLEKMNFREDKLQELIDKINRVPQKEFPLAAKKGVQFENLVNDILDKKQVNKQGDFYLCEDFHFKTDIVDKIANKLVNAKQKQKYIQKIVPSEIGNIKIYGFVDYAYPEMHVDLKTTGKYQIGKFKDNNQHKCYSLIEPIKQFNYLVTDFDRVYTETYVINKTMHDEFMHSTLKFNKFLESNRHLIINEKIFGK